MVQVLLTAAHACSRCAVLTGIEGAAVALRVSVVKQNRCMEPKPMLARRVRVYSVVRCTRQLEDKIGQKYYTSITGYA